jgi:hypothetical protein
MRGIGVATLDYEAYFESELLGALQAVFDEAWQEISTLPGNSEERRTGLAEMIILAHRSGLQPNRIKAAVLGRVTAK